MAANPSKTMIIKNGYLFDPLNAIDGEVLDIFIRGGRVVPSLSGPEAREATVIDAREDGHAGRG